MATSQGYADEIAPQTVSLWSSPGRHDQRLSERQGATAPPPLYLEAFAPPLSQHSPTCAATYGGVACGQGGRVRAVA